MQHPPLPKGIGPAQFGTLGRWVTVRCPRDYADLLRQAGGQWEPGAKVWLVERHRMGPLMRNLRRDTDRLFRQAGLDLD